MATETNLPHSRVFIESLQKDLMHIQPPKSQYNDNLTKGERKDVNGLRGREDITFTKADKGGGGGSHNRRR